MTYSLEILLHTLYIYREHVTVLILIIVYTFCHTIFDMQMRSHSTFLPPLYFSYLHRLLIFSSLSISFFLSLSHITPRPPASAAQSEILADGDELYNFKHSFIGSVLIWNTASWFIVVLHAFVLNWSHFAHPFKLSHRKEFFLCIPVMKLQNDIMSWKCALVW